MSQPRALRVAMIGQGFMGVARSQAWRVAPRFFDRALLPVTAVPVGRDASRASATAQKQRVLDAVETSTVGTSAANGSAWTRA